MCFSVVVPWTKHARHSRDLVRHAFDVAYRMGDFTYAAYSFTQLLTNYLVVGDPLADAQAEAWSLARSVDGRLVLSGHGDLISAQDRFGFERVDGVVRVWQVEEKDGKTVVTSRLTGNFPGSPVDLRFFFELEGEKIASLEIIP